MLAPTPIAGIDVGKTFLDLGFDPAARPLRFRNDAPGIAALIEALRRRGAARVALEAIGPYAHALTGALVAAGARAGAPRTGSDQASAKARRSGLTTSGCVANRPCDRPG